MSSADFDELDNSQIKCLTDDCLILIFAYLPLNDRIVAEYVCSKWRSLMCYGNIRALNVFDLPFSRNHTQQFRYYRQNNRLSEQHTIITDYYLNNCLECVLNKCQNLEFLRFQKREFSCIVNDDVVANIVKLCPKLKGLVFKSGVFIMDCAVAPMKPLSLTKLCISDCIFMDSEQTVIDQMTDISANLSIVFAKWKLESLDLTFYALTSLPIISIPTLRKLRLDFTGIADFQLRSICTQCPKLQYLSLICCNRLRDFSPIESLCELKTLILDDCHFLTASQLNQIRLRCRKLRRVSLIDVDFNEVELEE